MASAMTRPLRLLLSLTVSVVPVMVTVPRFCQEAPLSVKVLEARCWLTRTVVRSLVPLEMAKGASDALRAEPGQVAARRYWPGARPAKVQVDDALLPAVEVRMSLE